LTEIRQSAGGVGAFPDESVSAGPSPPLRLFVVGESSGDPETWSPYGSRRLVFANDAEEAVALAGDLVGGPASEVMAERPALVFYDSGDS
jgi:hypothetical protein